MAGRRKKKKAFEALTCADLLVLELHTQGMMSEVLEI